MNPLRFAVVLVLASACGDDAATPIDAAPAPDAPRAIDAGPPDAAPLCPTCLYAPEPLAPGEMSAADQQTLAEKFNPAQVFTDPVSRSTPMDYLLIEGGGLMSARVLENGPYWMRFDMTTAALVMPQPDLLADDWSTLPTTDGMGNDIGYFIDAPGDNTGMTRPEETWSAAYAAVEAMYPPTQYAHLFWLSRADRLLCIQYWFYYPWNKYANNHEGDWEHVNIVLRDGAIVMAHFSFHAAQAGLMGDQLIRVADRDGGDGDHVVVFTGGDACLNYGDSTWCGSAAGASFPYPGVYPTNTQEVAAGGTTMPGRPFHADQFTVVVLPRLDEDVAANLSWYKLPILSGQPEVLVNHPAVIATNGHRGIKPPGATHFEFEQSIPEPYDVFANAIPEPFVPPVDWTMIANPSTSF